MNARSYKTVFSKRLGTLVAVGEHATSQGKANGAGSGGGAGASATLGYIAALTAGFAFVSLAWAAPANNALPTSGTVVQGAASMAQSANQLNITQSTQRAAINWQSFDIGSQARVQVYQPNAQSVLLNRVVGNTPSQIFGQMQANGHVILVNPNGVMFGKDGSVNAGGFTASTLNISDANFMAGNMVYERNGSTAGIVNQGNITTAPGGYVALLGATVSNEGSINTHGGSVVMGAGETIKVPVSGTGRIKLELTPAAINASVSNSKDGSIVTEGGQVYMQALALNRAAAQIIQSGSIDTTGEQGGGVHLLADGGVIKVDGRITANSTGAGNKGGDIIIGRDEVTGVLAADADVRGAKLESLKGFVETSGQSLKFDGISVFAKDWLLDPFNVNIDTAIANTISANLANTDITIETTLGSSVGVNTPGDGNITVNGVISKAGAAEHTLTLTAFNGIDVNQNIGVATGAGKLNVVMTANGGAAASKGITINKAITTNNGFITLNGTAAGAANGVTLNTGASITAGTGDVNVTGVAVNGSAISIAGGVAIKGANVTLDGTSIGNVAVNGSGTIDATGNLIISGISGNSGGYTTITNNKITAAGDIKITAKGSAKHGIWLGNNVAGANITSTAGQITIDGDTTGTVGALSGSGSGSAVTGRAIITAEKDITIKGKTLGYYAINGLNDVTSTTGNILVDGYSRDSQGVVLSNMLTAKNGKVDLIGTSGGPGTTGVNINATYAGIEAQSYNVQGVAASGNGVLLGTGTFKSTSTTVDSLIEGKTTTGGTGLKATAGTLNFDSGAGKVFVRNTSDSNGGVELRDGSVINTKGDVTFGRKDILSTKSSLFLQGLRATADGGKLTFLGDSATANGIGFQDYGGTATSIVGNNGAKILIDGKSTASGYAGVNMKMVAAVTHSVTANGASGIIDIKGTSTSGSGVRVDIAKITANDGSLINITGTGGGTSEGVYIANAVTANGGGNINITGNTIANNGSGTAVSITAAGAVVSDGVAAVGSVPAIPAGTVTIIGDAGTGSGISNAAVVTGGTVGMTGTAKGAGNAVYSSGAITSTVGGVSVKGTNTNSTTTGGGGTTLQGKVTAVGDINLEGYSSNTGANQGLVIQNAVESTGGSITVTGQTNAGNPGQRAVAITQLSGATFGSLKTSGTNKTININANTLLIASGAPGSFIDAGNTGTVNIKTTTSGNEILIGGADVMNTVLASQKLGIDKTELDRITAGKLVIGDIASTGKITVTAATTTATNTGNITLQTGGDILVDKALTVDATKNLTLNGAGANSTVKQTAAIVATGLELLGANAEHTLTNTGNRVGILVANTKKLDYTNSAALTVEAVNGTTGITTKEGASITTQSGNLHLKESINNQNSGNVVVGAGVAGLAGELSSASSGDVKTYGKGITHTGGKLIVYSGSAANTGLLSQLNTTFSTLSVDGTTAQNADTNVAYNLASLGIAGSTASAQVIFREKVTITNGLVGTKVETTYGNANTKTDGAGVAALLVDTKNKLKQEIGNSGTASVYDATNTSNTNVIKISKAVIIDSLNGSLPMLAADKNSTGTYINAKEHTYGPLTSNKYTIDGIAGDVNVDVKQLALTGSITPGRSTYGDSLVAGTASFTNKVDSDVVNPAIVNIATAGNTSGSGNLNAGTYVGIQSVKDVTGADAANYSFTNVKGDYKVDQRQLTIAPGSVATKTADGTTAATVTPGALSNLVGTETLGVASTGTFSDANAGNNKAVNAFYTLQNGANGGAASNYILALGKPGNPDTRMTGNILASVNPVINPTPLPVNNNTGSRVSAVSGFGGSGAATGVLDDKPVTESREVCSDVFPENCECQPSVIPSIEICFAPKRVAATKEEK